MEIVEIKEEKIVEKIQKSSKEVQDGQGSSSQIQVAVKKQTQKERKLEITKEKEQLVVESKQREEIQLVGTVKFDSKLEVYHDRFAIQIFKKSFDFLKFYFF